MNATTQTPTRDLVEITRHIAATTTALTHLAGTLSGQPTVHSRVSHPRAIRLVKVKTPKSGPPTSHGRIPRALMNRIKQIEKKSNARPPLTEADKRAIRTLLEKTNVPVRIVAKLYSRTPAYIYALNASFGNKAHRGSPALMAGIRRLKRSKHKVKHRAKTKVKAPVEAAPAPAEPITIPA